MAERNQDDSHRESLMEVYAVLVSLGRHCDSIDELMGMIRLAVGDEQTPGNDAQLRLLMKLMKTK